MKNRTSKGAATQTAKTSTTASTIPFNGAFDFDTAEIDYEAGGINGSYPNTLLIDDKKRLALARKGQKAAAFETIKPVSLPEALNWYIHTVDIQDCGWGFPERMLSLAAESIQGKG